MNKKFWMITAALAMTTLTTSLMNAFVFPLFDSVFSPARDISVWARAIMLVALGLGTTFKPQSMHLRALDWVIAVCLSFGAIMLIPALAFNNAVLLVVTSSLFAIGRGGVDLFIGLSASSFDERGTTAIVTIAFTFSYLTDLIVWRLPLFASLLLFVLLPIASYILTFRAAQPALDEASQAEAPADVAITRPATFLPLASQVFVCIFMFNLAFGFSLRFNETNGTPVSDILVIIPVAALTIYVLATKRNLETDALTSVSFILVAIGFFLVSAEPHGMYITSNLLLSCGNTLFDMIAWTVLIAVAHRNPANAVSVFCWGHGMSSSGVCMGAGLGIAANALAPVSHDALVVLAGCLLGVFLAYALFGLRNFSFEDTIAGVESTEVEQQKLSPTERFDERCDQLAEEYGLSPRESEMFRMLACGRDRTYIEEQLVISRNTVKAHVKHIYAKLGIHSHQELIALVQDDDQS